VSLGKYLQEQIDDIHRIIRSEIGILDLEGNIIASSERIMISKTDTNFYELNESKKILTTIGNKTYKSIYVKNKLVYILYIKEFDKKSKSIIDLIELNIKNSKAYYDEKHDKKLFYKQLLLEDEVDFDISVRARELDINFKSDRIVFIINTEDQNEYNIADIVEEIFPNNKDCVLSIDEENIVLIKTLEKKYTIEGIENYSKSIIDILNSEILINVKIGLSSIKSVLKDLRKSYTEAKTALLVGKIFEQKKIVYKYDNLGIGRLINSLPENLCNIFLSEIFKYDIFENFDNEISQTIEKFFENNLNVSETSRKLYVHRNTLVYRLDKIQKLTGYDIRKFDDAIIFKFALMVKRYLDKKSKKK
jgi:carbohydrate diacid regulator